MKIFELHRSRMQKFLLALASLFDLLAGCFASYFGVDPFVYFLAYALDITALYIGRSWVPVVLCSLSLSAYGAMVSSNELRYFLIIAAILKCMSPFFKGWLVLKSEVQVLAMIMSYLRENPHVLFVIPFMLLLTLAAVELALGNLEMADRLAVYAYYQLVGGVVAALVLAFKEKRRYTARTAR